ncbi:MAG: VOC family protein [Saprospiraceae bacterium]|nr:VOC family protein [Saprospiraceae bacterium]
MSIFPDSNIHYVKTLNSPHSPGGSFDIVSFELSGNPYFAISAGPLFPFNESVSFMVYCDSQEEIDYYWEKLTDGGAEQPCGWLKDRYGLSWQITSSKIDEVFKEENMELIEKVMEKVLKMKKIDYDVIDNVYNK